MAPFAGGCLLLVDKPQGWTSFDVCAVVRNRFRKAYGVAKVGHTGTLDPMATGLLVLCVGRATKAVNELTGAPKRYEGVLRLGEETSSQDADTDVTALRPWRQLTRGELRAQAASMLGDVKQCPPMYSAVKVGGTRLYELARQGKVIERRARDVRIDTFDLFFDVCGEGEDEHEDKDNGSTSSSSPSENGSIDDDDVKVACQDVRFRVACSKGTYVRTLANDLGNAVGSAAHLTALRRTHVREFSIENAWNLNHLCESLLALADAR